MREIKFRAWDTLRKQYLPDRFIDQLYLRQDGKLMWWSHEGFAEVDYLIPEFFTGLHDKNGQEYYFDDIAKWNNKLWVIVWSKTLAGIQLQPIANYRERQENTKIKRLYGPSFGIGQAQFSERIGNIHQNPELMRSE